MSKPLILYSTVTWLAWSFGERYYGGIHYVWCSPFFRPRQHPAPVAFPPTSIPGLIYDGFAQDIEAGDRHSHWIEKNRIGILKGIDAQLASGVIQSRRADELRQIVGLSEVRDFRPFVMVIPFAVVENDLIQVPPDERAHPSAEEYRLEALSSEKFDIIELRRY